MSDQNVTPARELLSDAPEQQYVRFTLSDRVQHLVMLVSFTTLAITGLVQKFALNSISVFLVRLWGGIENIRSTHHVAATLLMLVAVYHLISIGYKVIVLRRRMAMLPSLQDIKDAWTVFAHNLGLGKSGAQMGRYTFEEKAEYWALVWGIVVMGLTGFIMWNPLATVRLLPGEIIPAAKAAHGAEALLAVLAIVVWHMYGVHLKRFNKAMWTGRLSEKEMLHEHPLELADIKAGMDDRLPEPKVLRRRRTLYYPIATVVGLGLLFAVYGFVSGEQTAITTVPPQLSTVEVYVPQTPTPLPPTPTSAPTVAVATAAPGTGATVVTWQQISPVLTTKCIMCHSTALATKGLSFSSYADTMKGGDDGPVVIPNDSANSKLFQIQSVPGHPGQLTAEELAIVSAWIDGGALEK
jgi:cytochrome b subunit of formate dehydrogenase